jgi:hypothetical protein
MNPLLATALAAGELICEFNDGYRKSYLAELTRDAPRTELLLVYEAVKSDSAQVIASSKPGRKPVQVRADSEYIHLIQADGASVRVTTLTECTRTKLRGDDEICTRFAARHAWHFDTGVHMEPDASFKRQPTGAATGTCEPWRVD